MNGYDMSCPVLSIHVFLQSNLLQVGGPNIPIATGRRDSLSAATNQTVINNIPPPTFSITALKQNFQNHGLDSRDLVSLSGKIPCPAAKKCLFCLLTYKSVPTQKNENPSKKNVCLPNWDLKWNYVLYYHLCVPGAHTIGRAHCRIVDPQITPTVSPDLNPAFAANLSRICLPANSPAKQRQTVHLDFITKDLFDNAYFQNILAKRAIFHTDAELLNATDTMQLVQLYATNQAQFFQQFSISMVKMSQLGVLTGNQGVIRKRCSVPNWQSNMSHSWNTCFMLNTLLSLFMSNMSCFWSQSPLHHQVQ